MEPLASLDDLNLEFDLSDGEKRIAQGALETLSDDARYYSGINWKNGAVAPRQAVNTVLKAARRHMRNPDGYVQSRAGDETLGWTDRGEEAGEAHFTRREIEMLRSMGDRPAIFSVQVTPYRTEAVYRPEGYVPVSGHGDPFLFYRSDGSPW